MEMAPTYFEYLDQVLFNELPSILSKIVGVFSVSVKGRISQSISLVVMENVLPSKCDIVFDLKGSTLNRKADPTKILMDENFLSSTQH